MGRIIAAILAFLLLSPALAGQTVIPNYDKAREDFFWPKLYLFGGWTLYCAAPFGSGKTSRGLQVEHVYPASWIADHLDCGTRSQCRQNSQDFNFMEADLHNLFPEYLRGRVLFLVVFSGPGYNSLEEFGSFYTPNKGRINIIN